MKLSARHELKGIFISGSISGLLTAVFMVFFVGLDIRSVIAGFLIGFFANLTIYTYKTRVEPLYARKLNLILLLLTNTIIQVMLILTVTIVFVGLIFLEGDYAFLFSRHTSLFSGIYLIGMIYGLVLSMVFSFISIVGTIIGKNMLPKLFIGKYRKPVEEERIFMFLDIASSTSIAEGIGHMSYLSLLNDFFYDVAEPVNRTKGEIYKYVGDEVIITWKMKTGLKDNNCVKCFFYIDEALKARASYYNKTYGLVPDFKAGLHGGLTVIGEMGFSKREIAYIGDVMNTTSRIESECNTLNRRLLISKDLADFMNLPGLELAGTVKLRGKEKEMNLYSVKYI